MYEKLSITENTLQILCLFTHGFESEFYIREVRSLLNISPRTAQLILDDLEKKGILESKLKGKIRLYRLNPSNMTKRYLVLVEQYKSIVFLQKDLLIKEIIEKITPYIDGIGAIFGSYAKGLQRKGSDLDIFVAGSYSDKIEKVSKIYGLDISIKRYPMDKFGLSKDVLVKEVLKDHVVFLSAEQFIEKVFENH